MGLSTVQTFFEDARDDDGNKIDNLHYFAGKKIMDAGEKYLSHAGNCKEGNEEELNEYIKSGKI